MRYVCIKCSTRVKKPHVGVSSNQRAETFLKFANMLRVFIYKYIYICMVVLTFVARKQLSLLTTVSSVQKHMFRLLPQNCPVCF